MNRYGSVGIARMRAGNCPECGHRPSRHDGFGGPNGCTLTDNGAAQRIHDQWERDHPKVEKERHRPEEERYGGGDPMSDYLHQKGEL